MPTSFIQQVVTLGLASLGTLAVAMGPTVGSTPSIGSAPEIVTLEEAPASRIDPALLNNPTLRRAIATVGPELVADSEIREAIRTRRFDESLMSNPTVQRAMLRVGPSLMADPQLSAAVRSGELGPEMLSDPALISILRGLDPTIFDAETESSVVVTSAPIDLPAVSEPLPTLDIEPVTEVAEVAAANEVDEARYASRREWAHGRGGAAHARRDARAAERSARNHARAEDRAQTRENMGRVARGFFGLALDVASHAVGNRR